MQGLPAKLLTPKAVNTAVKADAKSSVVAVDGSLDVKGEASKAEAKNSFSDLFSGLIGGESKELEGKGEKISLIPADMAKEVSAQVAVETKLDALLKVKGQDQGVSKENNISAISPAQSMSSEVLQNINNLITRVPPSDPNSEVVIGDKVATSSSNLEALLKSLRGDKAAVTTGEEVIEDGKEIDDTKKSQSNALDFLLKTSKESDVGVVESKDVKMLKNNQEMGSKLGLSSEDFISNMNVKGEKSSKGEKILGKLNLEGTSFDPKELLKKQTNESMKSYGQKQDLLNNGLIKNTNDLAFKETKFKANAEELKSPEMKIGAELAHIKESFIQPINKEQQNTQMDSGNAGKVLDISKMDTANHTEIIKRISDYVQQSQVANSNSLDLTVKHDSLGQFKIQVNRPMDPRSNQMDMQITTSTAEGHEFFMKNEIGLMKNLSQAGIQLSDLRIVSGGESSSFAQNDSRQPGNNNQYQGPKEQMSFDSGDSRNGSERRRELWQEARANQQRYGA